MEVVRHFERLIDSGRQDMIRQIKELATKVIEHVWDEHPELGIGTNKIVDVQIDDRYWRVYCDGTVAGKSGERNILVRIGTEKWDWLVIAGFSGNWAWAEGTLNETGIRT